MPYTIRQQGGSFLILECNPMTGNRAQAERLVAVCGNSEDAGAVVLGLQLVEAGNTAESDTPIFDAVMAQAGLGF